MLVDDIADFLSSGIGGLVEGTNLFAGLMPEAPDSVTVVYETGGLPPLHAMSAVAATAFEQPRIQVVCRASAFDYATARTNAHSAFKLLDGMPARLINGVSYKWAAAVQSPFLMGRDNNGRPLVACNYNVIKDLSP